MGKGKGKKNFLEEDIPAMACYPQCPYFPNMDCREGEWHYDEALCCKVRNKKKEYRCMYDGHPIDWYAACPRKENQ